MYIYVQVHTRHIHQNTEQEVLCPVLSLSTIVPRDRASYQIRREVGSRHASMILLSPSPRALGFRGTHQLFQDFYVGFGDSNSGPVLHQISNNKSPSLKVFLFSCLKTRLPCVQG